MIDNFSNCKRCGSSACYRQDFEDKSFSLMCLTCGFTTNTHMTVGSEAVKEATKPQLYKDLMYVDEAGQVWLPASISVPEKGMVFLEGTSVDDWGWSAMKSKMKDNNQIKMDKDSLRRFGKSEFLLAMSEIGMFD